MAGTTNYNRCGEEIESLLKLQTAPVSVKMLQSEKEIPESAFRPVRHKGYHYAQCQAFALSRRDRLTVAMLQEDNWCPAPLIAYGLVPFPEKDAAAQSNPYDHFAYGKYIGILTAPMQTADFLPDVILIYLNTNQLRHALLSLKEEERPLVKTNLFPFSCAWSITSPVIHNEYWVNLPDPGEYVRALTQAGEMILSIPVTRLDSFMDNLYKYFHESMFAGEQMMMQPDFPQPELYKKIFEDWSMEHS